MSMIYYTQVEKVLSKFLENKDLSKDSLQWLFTRAWVQGPGQGLCELRA